MDSHNDCINVPEKYKCSFCFKVFERPLRLPCEGQHSMCLMCARAAAQEQHAKTDVTAPMNRLEKYVAATDDESIRDENNNNDNNNENSGTENNNSQLSFPCPMCATQVPFDLASNTLGFTADDKMAREIDEWKRSGGVLCYLCDQTVAKFVCDTCAVRVCEECFAASHMTEQMKAHRMVREVWCSAHPDQVVTMCCATDGVPVCTKCVSEGTHASQDGGHPLCSVDEMVTTVTARITAGIAECAAQCDAVTTTRKHMSNAIEILNKSYAEACDSVNTYIDDIITRLNGVRAEKLAEVKVVWRCQHDVLESQVGVLGSAKAYMSETIDTARCVVEARSKQLCSNVSHHLAFVTVVHYCVETTSWCSCGVHTGVLSDTSRLQGRSTDGMNLLHKAHIILKRLEEATALCFGRHGRMCYDVVQISLKETSNVVGTVRDGISTQGDHNMMRRMGTLYSSTSSKVAQDYSKAMEWFMKATKGGDEKAMLAVGVLYHKGHGVTRDHGKAVEWYIQAAERGSNEARRIIGNLFQTGSGVPRVYSKAMEWYMQAAECGDAEAMRCIGDLYNFGLGVTQDCGKAMEWFIKAAEGGDTGAMSSIGLLYKIGDGVTQDYNKAMEWFTKAAEGGNIEAMNTLGCMCNDDDDGATPDHTKAMEWHMKAAERGSANAQYYIGVMYEFGRGVPRDTAMALEWYKKAAQQGHRNALGKVATQWMTTQHEQF